MSNQPCSTNLLAGASFSLHPMSNDFVRVIENALKETDTSKVWMETDDVTTTVQGKVIDIFEVTKSICSHAASTGEHIAFQATYSLGWPKGEAKDVSHVLEIGDNNELNDGDNEQYVAAKFALYPLGGEEYVRTIYEQIEQIKEYVNVSTTYYATKLEGRIVDVFTGLEKVFRHTIEEGCTHTVLTVTLSANSPSHRTK